MHMWRAVDSEGEVLEILVQPQRDKAAAARLLRKLLRRQGFVPTVIVTDKLRSYGAESRSILHNRPWANFYLRPCLPADIFTLLDLNGTKGEISHIYYRPSCSTKH
jgi:transposase-like protein